MDGNRSLPAEDAPRQSETPWTANPWVLDCLQPLRAILPDWPAVLPARLGDPIRPLKIGIHQELAARLPAGEAQQVLRHVLARYARSSQYIGALIAPGSWRYALDGTPVEPVAKEHKEIGKPAQPGETRRAGQEVSVMPIDVKAIKITVVLDALALKPTPPGIPVALDVSTPGGLRTRATISSKSYRRALEAIRQHGPENVAVILQGRMIKPGEITEAGLVVQQRKAPPAAPDPASQFSSRLTPKAKAS